MTILRPSRREPRAVAVDLHPQGVAFAVCSPWEIGSVAVQRCLARNRALALRRIVRREKPTILVTRAARLVELVERIARELGLPVAPADLPPLPPAIARDLFPEVPMLAPTRALESVARSAIAAVLHADYSPRLYAPRYRPTLHESRESSDR